MFLKISQNSQQNAYARVSFSFGLPSVISVAYFVHVFVWWKSYGIIIDVVRIFEIPYPANKYLLKVSYRNLETRREIFQKLTGETAFLY